MFGLRAWKGEEKTEADFCQTVRLFISKSMAKEKAELVASPKGLAHRVAKSAKMIHIDGDRCDVKLTFNSHRSAPS